MTSKLPNSMRAPKVLFVDIETAPSLGYVWGKWEQNVIEFTQEWYMLSFAAKWQGEKQVRTYALPDYPSFKKNKECDKTLVKDLWKLFDEADVVIAHNGDKFDIKKSNARFIQNGLRPYSPFKSIDTLKDARNRFGFTSNKLDDIARALGLGRKLPHTGFHTWKGCMTGNEKSWRLMRRYNAQDVVLLEKVYEKLKAWSKNHPDFRMYDNRPGCPICKSTKVQKRGARAFLKRMRQSFQCRDCGHWFSGEIIK